jgi:hypothetical protein
MENRDTFPQIIICQLFRPPSAAANTVRARDREVRGQRPSSRDRPRRRRATQTRLRSERPHRRSPGKSLCDARDESPDHVNFRRRSRTKFPADPGSRRRCRRVSSVGWASPPGTLLSISSHIALHYRSFSASPDIPTPDRGLPMPFAGTLGDEILPRSAPRPSPRRRRPLISQGRILDRHLATALFRSASTAPRPNSGSSTKMIGPTQHRGVRRIGSHKR